MDNKAYYQAPDQEIFDHIKTACLAVWARYYSECFPYMCEKFGRIVRMQNIGDNYMTLIAAFNGFNQVEFFRLINDDAAECIENALLSVNSFDTLETMKAVRSKGLIK